MLIENPLLKTKIALNDETAFLKNVRIYINEEELKKINSTSSFISISNRPIGYIEEYVLASIFKQVRSNFCFLDNSYLKNDLRFYSKYLQENDITQIPKILTNQFGLGLFPVGNFSNFETQNQKLTDSRWDKLLIKEITKNNVPIIPIYLRIENDNLFKSFSNISIKDLDLHYLNKLIEINGLEISVTIGKAIKLQQFSFKNQHQLGQFLRAKLYGLDSKLNIEEFYKETNQENLAIVDELHPDLIYKELQAISDTNRIGVQGNFEVYIAKAKKIPNTLQEIGRLREITFRSVGEGTNLSSDLDSYDLHYLHLFVYDVAEKKLVGAYRIGDGNYIFNTLGKKGFYTHSLFKMKPSFSKILKESIELGRSFVRQEYQNHRLPLFLLWKGIQYFLHNHSTIHYIIGPVSISNTYSKISKSFIVAYIMMHHWNEKLAKKIIPRNQFKSDFKKLDYQVLLDASGKEVKLLDSIIEDIDPIHKKIPILLKKYFTQNAEIIGFNVDPNFNDALDGLMITNIDELQEQSFEGFEIDKIIDYVN